MFLLWLFVASVSIIQSCLCAAVVDAGNVELEEGSKGSGAFRDTGAARIPHIMAEAANQNVISTGQPHLHDFLELHQSDPRTMSSFKEKRCKTFDLVGSSSLPTLHLTRRDLQSENLKKRCELCKEGMRCKKLGKCEICAQICERYEAAMKTRVLDLQERDTVGITSRFGDDLIPGLSEKEDRYYTVGTFAPGPIFNLLTRLLGIHNTKDTIERFIVLAKAKTKGSNSKQSQPVVIDTAHVFSVNEGKPKALDFELHEVTNGTKSNIDSLTSKLNSELDKAMDAKRKTQEHPYLTPEEIDEIIQGAVSDTEKPSPIVGASSSKSNDLETTARSDDQTENDVTTTKPSTGQAQVQENIVDEASQSEEESDESTEAHNAQNKNRPQNARANEEYQQPAIENRMYQQPNPSQSFNQPYISEPPNQYGGQFQPPQNFEPYNGESPNQNEQQFSYFSEPLDHMPLPYSDNQYGPSNAGYSYQYSPKAYGPKPIIPAEESEQYEDDSESDSNPIYVPDGVVTDDTYGLVGKSKDDMKEQGTPEKQKTPEDLHGINNNPITDDTYDLIGKSKDNFDEQYVDLKGWAKENVGSHTPEHHKIPEALMHSVSDIIDGAAASAKTLNEKITKLVKTKANGLNPAAQEQIVKLNNMKEFTTMFSPDEQSEIMDKTMEAKPIVPPYDTHPRMESRYKNGQWSTEKLAPSKPPYPTRYQERTSELVGSQPFDASDRRPYIDPKLLDMSSIVQDLKRVPDYIFQKAGDAFRPQSDLIPATTITPPMLLSRSETDELENSREEVACSHEDSDEYYREAGQNDSSGQEKLIVGQTQAETREAKEEESSSSEEAKPEDTFGGIKEDSSQNRNGTDGEETVACSKEKDKDDYELMHFKPNSDYDGYRSSIKQGLSKLHLPTIDELIHPKSAETHPKHSSHKKDESEEKEKAVSDMIKNLNKKHKHGRTQHPVIKDDPNGSSSEEVHPTNENFRPPPDSYMQPLPMNFNPNFPPMNERPILPPSPQWQVKAEDENDEIIGSPILESRFQQGAENFTHLGKIVPEESHPIPLHNRDVSDQMTPKSMYFVGDGIKLPLNMKQQGDGSLHLSLDVKNLCKCKHCNRNAERNSNSEQEDGVENVINSGQGENLGMVKATDDVIGSEDQENLLEQPTMALFNSEEHDKTEITKRSPRPKNLPSDGGELEPIFDKHLSNEIFDEVIPIKKYSTNGEGRGLNLTKRKVGLMTDVLDWMKKIALDEAKLHKVN